MKRSKQKSIQTFLTSYLIAFSLILLALMTVVMCRMQYASSRDETIQTLLRTAVSAADSVDQHLNQMNQNMQVGGNPMMNNQSNPQTSTVNPTMNNQMNHTTPQMNNTTPQMNNNQGGNINQTGNIPGSQNNQYGGPNN